MRVFFAATIVFLLAGSLWAQQTGTAGPVGPSTWSLGEGERLYHHFCTPCHGYYGQGNGYNARFLEKKPADHTDPMSMSKRTDAKLFEIVRDGGAKSGLSNQMPPWGKALSAQRFDHAHRPEHVEGQIWFLVNYMRFLQENGRELARKHPELAQTAVILPGMVPQVAPEVVPAPMAERAVAKPAPERPMMVPAAPPKPVTPTAVAQAPPQKIPEKAPTKEAPASVVEAKPSGPVPVEPPTSAAPKPATAHPGQEKAAQALAAWKSLIAFDPSRNIPGLRGNAASGRIYYVENCATCHGAEGKGDGPTATAAHMDPMPRNHTDGVYMNPKSDADLHKVIAEGGIAVGKSIWMPDWADKLSDEQIWDLIAYMRTIAVPRYTLKVKK